MSSITDDAAFNSTSTYYATTGGSSPSGTVWKASTVVAGQAPAVTQTIFTFAAVTVAGTYLVSGSQPTISNAVAANPAAAFSFAINGTAAPYYTFNDLAGGGNFSILLTLAVGDVVTVVFGLAGQNNTTWAAGGIAGLTKITVTP
jgi:hypothetical protein